MAQNTELQERYSSLVLAKQRATSLFANLFNRSYEGTPTAGAVKIPVRDTEVVAGSNYNTLTGAELTAAATSYKTLVIDKDNYVNELIDGHTADSVPDGLVAERLDSAGYSMGIATDAALRDCLLTEGTSFDTTTALTKATVYEKVMANDLPVTVINCRFLKPLDKEMIEWLVEKDMHCITYEGDTLIHGLGSLILEYTNSKNLSLKMHRIGIPDVYVQHGSERLLRRELHIDMNTLMDEIEKELKL